MDNIDKRTLESSFPKGVKAIDGKRYDRDDILKVLSFMKENPKVRLSSITEFSGISQGALNSWRKDYGHHVGIRTKNYGSHDMNPVSEISTRDDHLIREAGKKDTRTKISLSMIQELQKLYQSGEEARMTVNNTDFIVDGQYLYVEKI